MKNALDKVVEIVGSKTKLAARLHLTKGAVGQWWLPGKKVPQGRCLEIERITKGMVLAEDLRPDLNWRVLRPADQPRPRRKKMKAKRD